MTTPKPVLGLAQIKKRLPHRAPILLLDEVSEYQPNKKLVAQRHFKASDPLFKGHFPGNPILPGVLVCEAIAQTGALLVALDKDLKAGEATYLFAGVEGLRFLHPVQPGNTLTTIIEKLFDKMGIYKFVGSAHVGNKLCAQATFSAKLVLNKSDT
ncbi:MAG TPA: 3-hydroxyacyl-ACP dehydratase FabZ [Alphaproteobacteria bacterium]|nr:3-hydroxyacyl-ACP dehydratase FabZ [Alphaproteobacteria bacterium]